MGFFKGLLYSPHKNMETHEKVAYNVTVPSVKWLRNEHADDKKFCRYHFCVEVLLKES